jgi:hypothetical protein
MYNVENVFKLLKSHDQELTLNYLVEILRRSTVEEGDKPELKLRRGP